MFEPDRNGFTPLYHQLRVWLEEEIQGGKYQAGSLLPSEREICERFRVSNITARRTLNELVRSGIAYRQAGVGTFVASTQRKLRLALVIFDFDEDWWRRRGESFSALIGGIAKITWECGAQFSIVHLAADRDLEHFIRTAVDERSFDGLLIRPAIVISGRHVHALEQRALPYVLVRVRCLDRVANSVRLSDEEDVYQATHHLIDLGHRRIGYVAGQRANSVFKDRFGGYARALEEAGIPIDPALLREEDILQTGEPAGLEVVLSLLRSSPRPTALVGATSPLVPWLYRAAQMEGLAIPGDISIVGADEELHGADMAPKLARFGRGHAELGAEAARLLLDLIEKGRPEKPREILLPPSFKVGGSTGGISADES